MSNLIPDTLHKKIRAEYRARFMLAGSSMAIGAAFFAALALFPSFGVLFITRPAATAQILQTEESKQQSADIARAQTLVTYLAPVATASSSLSNAIISALERRPNGVRVDSIQYVTTVTGVSITMEGVGDGRAQIDKYRSALQADSRFSSVRLPVDDLLGNKGSRFTITLAGQF